MIRRFAGWLFGLYAPVGCGCRWCRTRRALQRRKAFLSNEPEAK